VGTHAMQMHKSLRKWAVAQHTSIMLQVQGFNNSD
jgi:hypothetical protein